MPTPPPGVSKTIYVTPPSVQSAGSLPDFRTLPKPKSQTPPSTSGNVVPRTPSPNARYVTPPSVSGGTALPQLKPKSNTPSSASGSGSGSGGTMSGTSNGSSSTPSSASGAPKGGNLPPPSAGAAASAGLGIAARFFWRGLGAGVGWEASRQFQGGAKDLASEQKEQEAVQRAERKRQERYLQDPPYTEVVEKEKYEFEGGQSAVQYGVSIAYKYWYQSNQTVAYVGSYQGPISGIVYEATGDTNVGPDGNRYPAYKARLVYLGGAARITMGDGFLPSFGDYLKIVSVTRGDGQPDTGGNPPPTKQETRSQYNGAAPGTVAGDSDTAPPPPTRRPQPQPQPRPETPPPPTLYAPGVRGDLGTNTGTNAGTGTGTGSGEAPSPNSNTLGNQRIRYVTGSSDVSGTPSGLPEGIGTPSGLPEGIGSPSGLSGSAPSSGTGSKTGTEGGTQTQTQTQTRTQTSVLELPSPAPLFTPAPNPTSTRQDFKFPDNNPEPETKEEKKVTQTSPPTGCELNNACVLKSTDKIEKNQNKILEKVGNLADLADLTLLPIINNKLGDQLPGGISGYFKRAWEATKMDKVINLLTLIAAAHNAAMLSRNLGQTLGDAASQVLQIFNIKDHEKNPIDVNEVIGKSIDNAFKSLLGEEVWTGVKTTWNKANRIISSASQIIWSIRSIADSTREIMEWTAENTGKIGNALKRFRVVGENAYKWMPERVTTTNAWMRKIERVREGTDSLDDAASSFSSVLSEVQNIQEEYSQLQEQKQQFDRNLKEFTPKEREDNEPVKTKVLESKEASKAPTNTENVFRGEGEQN